MSAAQLHGAQRLYSGEQIQTCVARLGRELDATYGDEELTLIAVLHGGLVFAADLMRQLRMPVRLGVVVASSYRGEATTPEALELRLPPSVDVRGRHVLLVDDILDTGRTLSRLSDELRAMQPRTLRTAVLLDKPSRRVVSIAAEFRGFEIPDLFVVGYGLDWNERYRNLPDILALPPSAELP
ncbi:MAG: hypoxanthine phosphoribosyltransferase [Planctomycetota bacterium]